MRNMKVRISTLNGVEIKNWECYGQERNKKRNMKCQNPTDCPWNSTENNIRT